MDLEIEEDVDSLISTLANAISKASIKMIVTHK